MTAKQRSGVLARRLKDRKGKATLYPKGSDGRCIMQGCWEIAEWYISPYDYEGKHHNGGQICDIHTNSVPFTVSEFTAKRLPHIVRKEDSKLYVKCLFCNLEWRPLSFDLPKEDRDYGRIPHKCSVENCRQTILTRNGRQPRFLRGTGFKGLIKSPVRSK